LSKVNSIRKKALELVRKQDWPGAVKEYKRLAELDQSNPNVFNELGDIYLKTGNKSEAYEAFLRAIDSYTHVSLHNNAVAVCKKVLRLLPARIEVLTKLGYIRLKQGLAKEAESYYSNYLDKVEKDTSVDRGEFMRIAGEIAEAMPQSASLLDRMLKMMEQLGAEDTEGKVRLKFLKAYVDAGNTAAADAMAAQLTELGLSSEIEAVYTPPARDGAVITEENIWTEKHTAGERIDVDAPAPPKGAAPPPPAGAATPAQPAAPPAQPAPQAATPPSPAQPAAPDGASPPAQPESVYGYGEVDIPGDEPAPAEPVAPAPQAPAESEAPPAQPTKPARPQRSPAPADTSEPVHVSAIIDVAEDGGEASEADYRSHYDLGTAYLEMELFADAVREFQAASGAAQFRVKSLEMIGLCFLRQNQAGLAIKQLTKGLSLVGNDDREALGIKYNLGLAYEMAGDIEKARSQFEDVYVIDVTFRDVSDKLAKCTS